MLAALLCAALAPDPGAEPEPEPDTVEESGADSLEWDGSTDDLSALGIDIEEDGAGDDEPAGERGASPLTGSARLVGGYLRYPKLPPPLPQEDDGLFASIFRVIAHGDLGPHVSNELNVFAELSRSPGTTVGGTFATAGATRSVYRYPHLTATFWEDGAIRGELGADRFAFHIDRGRFFASVGRFPVSWSVANLFTPNDFFSPFSATAINRVYKPGVDALRTGVSLGALSSLELVAAMGFNDDAEPSWRDTAILGRASTVVGTFELAALGGKVARRWVAGASFQGDAGPIGLRGEGHLGIPDRDADGVKDGDEKLHGRLSVGPNVNLPWRNAVISAEYAFISDGAGDPARYINRAMRFFPDDLPYLAEHYVALSAGLEVIPILRLDGVGVVNATDGSGLAGPFLGLSVADEVDLSLGMYAPWGKRPVADPMLPFPELRSEMGLAPLTVFVQTRAYF